MNPSVMLSPADLLVKADDFTRKGYHLKAIDILKSASNIPVYAYTSYMGAKINILFARNMLHLQEDFDALSIIQTVPKSLRDTNPQIDADCRSVIGILRRRDAYHTWKAGHDTEALSKAKDAIAEFCHAEDSASMALDGRLKYNAQLNKLYANGLMFAIQKAPRGDYEPLVVKAVIAEDCSRDNMPPNSQDYLTGLTIVADLALGADLGFDQMFSLSFDPKYQKAYRRVLSMGSSQGRSWQEFLLEQTRASISIVSPNIIAKTLLLGTKILFSESSYEHELLKKYAVDLRYYSIYLTRSGANPKTRDQLENAISRLPDNLIRFVRRPNLFD